MNSVQASTAPTGMDTPALKRAKALLDADRALSFAEQSQARADMDAAGRNTLEHGFLAALYGQIDKRSDERLHEHISKLEAGVQREIEAHAAARPKRWAALTPAMRAAHLAGDKTTGEIQKALLMFVELMERDTSQATPPYTFEPPRY